MWSEHTYGIYRKLTPPFTYLTFEHRMDRTFARALGVKRGVAAAFIEEAGGAEKAAETVLEWTPETRPVRWVILPTVERVFLVEKLRAWAETSKADKFLTDASLFELCVTTQINPMYPCVAFREIPFTACMDLAAQLGVHPSEDALIYAAAYKEIVRHKSVTKQAMSIALRRIGLLYKDPSKVVPFPPEIFDNHPLRDVNAETMNPGEAMKLAPGRGIAVVREKKNMRNRIMFVGDEVGGCFKINEGASKLVKLLLELNTPVSEFKPW